ncbi:MAG TPA: hypothetical protein VGM88_26950 [Kofleriaceae bacterium]|jgi:hypothetical protein
MRVPLLAALLIALAACDPNVSGVDITAVDSAGTPIQSQDVPLSPLGQITVFPVFVRNTGGGISGVVTFSLAGAIAGDFVVEDADGMCTGSKLGANDTCMQNIDFTANHEGKLKATLAISTGDDAANLELDTDVFKPTP